MKNYNEWGKDLPPGQEKPNRSDGAVARGKNEQQPIKPIEFHPPIQPIFFYSSEDQAGKNRNNQQADVASLQTQEPGHEVNLTVISKISNDLRPKRCLDDRIARIAQKNDTISRANPPQHKVTPYETAQKLLRQIPMVISGNGLYLFDGTIYRLFGVDESLRFLMRYCRAEAATDGNPAPFLKNVLGSLKAEPNIEEKDVEEATGVVAFQNGCLELESGCFAKADGRYFITSYFDIDYRPLEQLSTPRFDAFVDDLACHDPILAKRIWEITGYLLAPDTAAKVFVILQGLPHSGKSQYGAFIAGCFNPEATTSLDLQDFSGQFALADLPGKRLCLGMDLPDEMLDVKAVSKLKELTGNDVLTADVKYQPRVKFKSTAKFLFATNNPILTKKRDDAFLERILVIPCCNSIPREQWNTHLQEDLAQERLPVILKALWYYGQLCANGYQFSGDGCYCLNQVTTTGPEAILFLQDSVRSFLSEYCVLEQGARVASSVLYQAFIELYPAFSTMPLQVFSAEVNRTAGGRIANKKLRVPGYAKAMNGFEGIRLLEDKTKISKI